MSVLPRNLTLAAPTLAVLTLLALTQKSDAYPADVFVGGAPLKGPALHPTTQVPTGSYSVSQQTGAAQYSFAIPVPPGRNGMSPQIALTYSSQNPVRGGVYARWDLNIPYIERDTSEGRLGERKYRTSLAGGQRLIRVDEPAAAPGVIAYRAESDADFVRYEHIKDNEDDVGNWRALHPNGNVFYFGMSLSAREEWPGFDEPDEPNVVGRWFVTRVVDPHGNEITYDYEAISGTAHNLPATLLVDRSIKTISWGKNLAAGISEDHARIRFVYVDDPPCAGSAIPPGASFTFRNGVRTYRGSQRLRQIFVESRPATGAAFASRHDITLNHDAEALRCDRPRAPLRLLDELAA